MFGGLAADAQCIVFSKIETSDLEVKPESFVDSGEASSLFFI
jgi:hypothetical protein